MYLWYLWSVAVVELDSHPDHNKGSNITPSLPGSTISPFLPGSKISPSLP